MLDRRSSENSEEKLTFMDRYSGSAKREFKSAKQVNKCKPYLFIKQSNTVGVKENINIDSKLCCNLIINNIVPSLKKYQKM